MNSTDATISVAVGLACFAIAAFSKKFYWLKGATQRGPESPRWAGRLFWAFMGAVFLFGGIKYFVLGY